MRPTVTALAPSTVTRKTGSRPWIISDEMSMNMLTRPSAQMLRGMARRPPGRRSRSSVLDCASIARHCTGRALRDTLRPMRAWLVGLVLASALLGGPRGAPAFTLQEAILRSQPAGVLVPAEVRADVTMNCGQGLVTVRPAPLVA